MYAFFFPVIGPATIQNLVVKCDGEICGGVLVENASDDFPQQKKLENLLNKRNSQEKLHHPVLSLKGKLHNQIFTPKYSQGINRRNEFQLGYTRKFLGNQLCSPRGRHGKSWRTFSLCRFGGGEKAGGIQAGGRGGGFY